MANKMQQTAESTPETIDAVTIGTNVYLLVHQDGRKASVRDDTQAGPFIRAGYRYRGDDAPDWLHALQQNKDNAGTI